MVCKSKLNLVLSFMIVLLLIMQPAFAQEPFSVKVLTEKQSIYVGNSAEYSLNVTNNLNESVEVQLIPTIFYSSWFSTLKNHTISIDSNETKSMDIKIMPLQGTSSGNLVITVSVCKVRSNVCSDVFINLQVIDKSQLKIISFVPELTESPQGVGAKFFFRLENLGESNIVSYKFQVDATDNSGNIVSSRVVDLDKIPSLNLYPRDGDASVLVVFDEIGDYDVSAKIIDNTGGVVQTEKSNITIILPPKVATESITRNTIPGLFIEKTTYVVLNKDAKSNAVEVKHPMFLSKFLYSYSDVPEIVSVDGKNNLVWVCFLDASGTDADNCEISLTAHYWVIYLILIVLILLSIYIYIEVEKPKIKKTHVNKGELHSVHIHIKNNSKKPLEDVIVSDTIPSILGLVGEYTVKPTTIKKKHDSVKMVWNLGKLKSKEERVLTYNVKPAVEVDGGINLPPVEIKAVNFRGKHEKVVSKSITLS